MSAQVVAQERDRNIWLAPIHVPVISEAISSVVEKIKSEQWTLIRIRRERYLGCFSNVYLQTYNSLRRNPRKKL